MDKKLTASLQRPEDNPHSLSSKTMDIKINGYNQGRQSVDITVDRNSIEAEQERTMCHTGIQVARVKILDPTTKKYCWFVVTAEVKNGKPSVELECIQTNTRKRVTGKFAEDWRLATE